MLELKNIFAGYGSKTVLRSVSAPIQKGRLTSIIGINGCGKSTLLKAILGILPISQGEITVDGKALSSMSRNEIARRVAYLSQGRSIPDMTVEQMVLHGRFPYLSYPRRYKEADREIAKRALNDVGIASLSQMPLSALSGGMQQNAYIAMALAQDTDYILLDEPTTYLDIAHQLDLMKLLRRLADSGKGIVTIMHDLPLALDFSDEIIALHNGAVVMQGTPSEICDSTVIHALFGVKMERLGNKYGYKY